MRTSVNVVGDSFGAGIVDHLSRAELAVIDGDIPLSDEEFVPPPPLLTEIDLIDTLKPPELPPRSPRPPKLNHHVPSLTPSQSQSHSIPHSPRSVRSPSPHSIRSPSPRSVCSHSPRPFRTHSPRLLRRTEPGYCALPTHDNQVRLRSENINIMVGFGVFKLWVSQINDCTDWSYRNRSPKILMSVIIYSPSCHSKPVRLSFFCGTQVTLFLFYILQKWSNWCAVLPSLNYEINTVVLCKKQTEI